MMENINTSLVWFIVSLIIIAISVSSVVYIAILAYIDNKETKRIKKEIEEHYLNGWHKVGDEWYYIKTMKNDLYINGNKIY